MAAAVSERWTTPSHSQPSSVRVAWIGAARATLPRAVRHLALASFLWAFSFGLIAHHLSDVDATFVAAVRLGLAAAVFLPFLRPRRTPAGLALRLAALVWPRASPIR